jgi:apolipoprotein N-acyltransferase
VRLIVWPESATPFLFEEEPAGRAAVLDLARETSAWVLLGSDQIERGRPARYYNVAFLVGPDGRQAGVYRKMHLVPFGEYVPLRSLLFFAAPLVDSVGDFGVGESVTVLPVDGHPVTTVICYESVFPYLARAAVEGGSQLLTAITNDAWYGWSSAPFQHYEQGRLRAIEFGRYFVRSANTGISAIVDPYGRVLASSGLFETTVLRADVRLLTGRTLYARIGDSLAWACVAVTLAAWALTWRPRERRRVPSEGAVGQ